jgi:inorganic pyrophosphatase
MMCDEKGGDDKIFVVPLDEIESYENKTEYEIKCIKENIKWFFSNYKSQDEDKWSRVERLINKEEANKVYRDSLCERYYNRK